MERDTIIYAKRPEKLSGLLVEPRISWSVLVGVTGIEPATSPTRTARATDAPHPGYNDQNISSHNITVLRFDDGAASGIRTRDLYFTKVLLYQLS